MASLFRSPRPLPPARFFPPAPLPATVQTTDSATANAAAKTAAKATAIENKRRRGRAVLRHLMARTHHRHLGPNASDAALRYLEGQRQLVAYLATMIERGGGRIKPDPEPVMDSSQNDKKRKSLWTRIF